MSGLRPKKQRYWITFLLDEPVEGSGFEPGLLHLTIVPWFVTDLSEEQVVRSFRKFFVSLKKVELKVGKKMYFGPHNDVAVNLVDENKHLRDMHEMALEWIRKIDARWAVQNPYVGSEFKPHIRRRENSSVQEGDIITPNFLNLVRANRHEDNLRVVAARAELK